MDPKRYHEVTLSEKDPGKWNILVVICIYVCNTNQKLKEYIMSKFKLLSFVAIFVMFVGVACGPSGPMADEDRTAVTGVVMVEDSYERVANATVMMEDGELTATTNENGVFTIIGAPTGSQEVMVESDMGSTTTTVEVEMNGSRIELFVN